MTTTTPHQETWLSVQDASAMLGVSPATLRRWSAAGEVEAFTTPGGHRRFALTTLKALITQSAPDAHHPAALGETAQRMVKVIRRHARSAASSPALAGLDDASREAMAHLGRRMTTALLAHLDAADPAERERALAEASSVAAGYAERGRRAGAHLADLVGVLARFRALFLDELAGAACRHGLGSAEATSLVNRGGQAIDRVLAALVSAWESSDR